jgi:hypothetical protein
MSNFAFRCRIPAVHEAAVEEAASGSVSPTAAAFFTGKRLSRGDGRSTDPGLAALSGQYRCTLHEPSFAARLASGLCERDISARCTAVRFLATPMAQ